MASAPRAHFETGPLEDADRVARILAAAERCFCGRGYSATSLREIAEAAGVSKSLLHYHFQSKEHLFLEVLVRIYNRLAARVTRAVADRGTATERALFALDSLFQSLRENPDFHVQARIWARSLSNDRLRAHAQRLREELRAELVRAIERILGPTLARIPITAEAAADLLWATVGGLGMTAAWDAERDRAEAAFQALRRLVALAVREGEAP